MKVKNVKFQHTIFRYIFYSAYEKSYVYLFVFFSGIFFPFLCSRKCQGKRLHGACIQWSWNMSEQKKTSFQFSLFILFDKMIFIMLFDNKFICASLIKKKTEQKNSLHNIDFYRYIISKIHFHISQNFRFLYFENWNK